MQTVHFQLSSQFKDRADRLFEEQKRKLESLFSDSDIQHIGGTSVPDLLTKGDLDINMRVNNEEDFHKAVKILKSIYRINQPNNWTHTYASFKDDSSFELPLGIQLTLIGSKDDYFVRHRDALLNNPEMIKNFNSLKLQYQDKKMEEYRTAKSQFLKDKGLV